MEQINFWVVVYIIIGVIIAGWFYNTESKKVNGPIDVPMANIVTMFVWLFWPLAVFILTIRWIQIH